MNTYESFRPSSRARRQPSRRLMLESLEDRIVMASSLTTPAAMPAAQVHNVSIAAQQDLNLDLNLTKLNITSISQAGPRVLNIAGTASGSVLGLPFNTPISGRVVAGRGGRPDSLELNLAALDTTMLGLNLKTSNIGLDLSGRRAGGPLDNRLRSALTEVLRSPSVNPLNTLLSDAQVLNAVNRSLDMATTRVGGFDAAGSIANVRLQTGQTRTGGLLVSLDNTANQAVNLQLAKVGTGQLGGLIGGLTGNRRTVISQLSSILPQITELASTLGEIITNPPPTTPTTPPLTPPPTPEGASTVLDLNLNPIDVNLLGLRIQTSQIRVTVSALPGSGKLLGNLLNTVGGILNLEGVNNALNNVLGNVVTLVNAAGLAVDGVLSTGPLGTPSNVEATTVQVARIMVAPVFLDLLGAIVQTSPIEVTITANTGQGQILGNVVAGLANLLNPLQGDGKIDVPLVTTQIQQLNSQLNDALPGIPATVPPPTNTTFPEGREVLDVRVPPIDLNLLGLILQTDTIEVNATAQTGDGKLLGNLLNGLLNTLSATPEQITGLNNELNTLLARVVGVVNNARLTLPANAVDTLSQALQTLALPDLVTATPGSTTTVLDLVVATPDTSPPVMVDLLGLVVTTSDIRARLVAQTGDGQILGNLVYNVSHLLDPAGGPGLLGLLNSLGVAG